MALDRDNAPARLFGIGDRIFDLLVGMAVSSHPSFAICELCLQLSTAYNPPRLAETLMAKERGGSKPDALPVLIIPEDRWAASQIAPSPRERRAVARARFLGLGEVRGGAFGGPAVGQASAAEAAGLFEGMDALFAEREGGGGFGDQEAELVGGNGVSHGLVLMRR